MRLPLNTPSSKSCVRRRYFSACQTTRSSCQNPSGATQFKKPSTHVSPLKLRFSLGCLLTVTNADCGWIFAQHFCNRLGPAYLQLKNVLNENDPAHAEVLNDIKRRFREETFTRESIAQVIHAHSELVSHQAVCAGIELTKKPNSDFIALC
jgi:hypothetical protein